MSGPLPEAISVESVSLAAANGTTSRISWILSCEALKSFTTSSWIAICGASVPVPRPTNQRTQVLPAWQSATGYGVRVGVAGTAVAASVAVASPPAAAGVSLATGASVGAGAPQAASSI